MVYMVFRHLTGANQTAIVTPVKTFAHEKDCIDACKHMRETFKALADGVIVVDGKPVTKVENLLVELGIGNVGFNYLKAEVAESNLLLARPNIIIQ